MSHLIVEIPKTSPDEGKWLFVIAENWIENHILFLPDNSYSAAHKIHLLKGGTHPDVVNWDRHYTFKIIDTFGTYEEARLNLPRVESGLPILDNNNTGRGQRERKKKKLTLPGESTTDFESENEVVSKPAPQSVVRANKHSKKSPKITSKKPQSSLTPILKPPAGLQINKNQSNVTAIPAKQTVDTEHHEPQKTMIPMEPKTMKPYNHNQIILDLTFWDHNLNYTNSYNQSYTPPPASYDFPSQPMGNISSNGNSSQLVAQTYGMPSTSLQGMRYPTPTPSPSTVHESPVSAPIIAQSVHQRYQHQGLSTSLQGILYPTPTPSPSTVHEFPVSAPIIPQSAIQRYQNQHPTSNTRKNELDDHTAGVVPLHGKVAPKKEMFMSALAKINDKLSVIEKSMKPISDEESSEIVDEFNALPLKTFADFDSFEKNVKKDAVMYKKLVSRIRLLGKRNSKNSAADYVRRAWSTVFADSLSKDVNWLGRRDKRVNNGLGKKGISSCVITKAVFDGIRSNKSFLEMEYELFVRETKQHMRNAKSRFNSTKIDTQSDEESDDN